MVEARLLSVWDGIVGSAGLIAIIVLALCVMVRAVKLADVLRRLGVIVGIVILLFMLPPIIVSLWSAMTFIQHIGIIALGIVIMLLLGASDRRPHHVPRK